MSTPDIIRVIQEEMLEDDDNQSSRLISRYNSAPPSEQQLIDEVLIAICGWGMQNLIGQADRRNYEVEN